MRKVFSITLIAIHLLGNTELGEFLKFPQLITHYFQHSRIDPRLDFLEFLAMHYGNGDGTRADDNEDSKLPYQNPNSHSFSLAYAAVLKPLSLLDEPYQQGKKIYGSRLLSSNPSEHVLRILQPPRA